MRYQPDAYCNLPPVMISRLRSIIYFPARVNRRVLGMWIYDSQQMMSSFGSPPIAA
jgi:hypothetical protein